MADFGLWIKVTEGSNDGPPVPNAVVTGELQPTPTDAEGKAVVDTVFVSVHAQGFYPYERQPYYRPSLQAPVTVSLQCLP